MSGNGNVSTSKSRSTPPRARRMQARPPASGSPVTTNKSGEVQVWNGRGTHVTNLTPRTKTSTEDIERAMLAAARSNQTRRPRDTQLRRSPLTPVTASTANVISPAFSPTLSPTAVCETTKPTHKNDNSASSVAERTLVFIDWDDTILCTHDMIEARNIDIDRDPNCVIPHNVRTQLHKLQNEALSMLESAIEVGTTVLVTNAAPGWIERSGEKCLPRVVHFIKERRLPVVYARQCVCPEEAADPTKWKPAAFGQVIEQRRTELAALAIMKQAQAEGDGQQLPPQGTTNVEVSGADLDAISMNIVSIGDGIYERVAARVCAEPQDLVKTIKFVDSPSITQLRRQLRLTAEILPEVTYSTESRSIGLRTALSNTNAPPSTGGGSSPAPTVMPKAAPTATSGGGVGRRLNLVASRARRKIDL